MSTSQFLLLTVFFTVNTVMAAGGHHDEGIPVQGILFQAINLGILLVILIWKLKTPIKEAFIARQEEYKAEANKTAQALAQAEESLKDIKERLSKLEQTEQTSYAQAEAQAEELKKKIEQESLTQAQKLKEDVKLIATAELLKAKNEIRKEMITAAIAQTESKLASQSESITKKSEAQFITDIQNSAGQVAL